MAIAHDLLFAFAESLQGCLIKKLNLTSHDGASRCASYLEEDASVVAMREELCSKKKRLEAVQAELLAFGL